MLGECAVQNQIISIGNDMGKTMQFGENIAWHQDKVETSAIIVISAIFDKIALSFM